MNAASLIAYHIEAKTPLFRLANSVRWFEEAAKTPEEDYEHRGGTLCPFCGAYSPRQCELEEESGGICPWEESEPDHDDLMEQRREDRELEARFPRDLED